MPIHDWTKVDAGIFHDFHHEWISTIKRNLNSGILPAGYYALAEQITGGLHPDVLALELNPRGPTSSNGTRKSKSASLGGGIALQTAPPHVRFTFVAEIVEYALKSKQIAIRHRSGDDVVAVIEIVSPGNKDSKHAIRSFVEKAVELLAAGIHLMIIDLFPPGPRDPQGIHARVWSEIMDDEFQLPPNQPLTLASYDAGEVKAGYVETVAVGDSLPDMPLFLEPRGHILVPLESAYQAAWEAVPERWREVLES